MELVNANKITISQFLEIVFNVLLILTIIILQRNANAKETSDFNKEQTVVLLIAL